MLNLALALKDLREIVRSLQANAGAVDRKFGVSRSRQLIELIRLRLGPGKLSPKDYYDMRIYRKDLSWNDKRSFMSLQSVSWRNPWKVIADDKLLTAAILLNAGVPTPRVIAVCDPVRSWGQVPALRTVAEISEFLLGTQTYPFVSKPTRGIYSQDVVLVESVDRLSAKLNLVDAPAVDIQEFAASCLRARGGTFFQELLEPHQDIQRLFGPRVCTVRMIVFADASGVHLFQSIWKIAVPPNVADNYWRDGNVMARLNRTTGVVEEAMSGLGTAWHVVKHHPTTGVELAGLQVPDYQEAVSIVLHGARCLLGVPMQAWDIALTASGPMALEVNVVGSPFLPQTATGVGLFGQPDFQAFVARRAA